MSGYTIQIVVLAAAYVLLVGSGVVNGLVSLYNWRLMSRIDGRKDLATRMTRHENELASYRELLDAFAKRLNRREGATRTRSTTRSTDDSGDGSPPTPELTPDELIRRYNAGQLN